MIQIIKTAGIVLLATSTLVLPSCNSKRGSMNAGQKLGQMLKGSTKDKMLGLWTDNTQVAPGVVMRGSLSYFKNGTSNYVGTVTGNGRSMAIAASSKWSLNGTTLSETVTSSNIPELLPVGFTDVSQVVYVDGKLLQIKDSDGVIRNYNKK